MPDDEVQAQPDWLGSALAKIGDLPTRLNQAAIDEGAAYRGRLAEEQPKIPETPSFGWGGIEPITQPSPQPQPPYDYYGANLESGRNLSRQSFVDSYNKQAAAEPRVAPLNAIASTLAGRPVTPYNANPSNYRQLSPSEEAERQRATQSEYAELAAGIATPELASAARLARFAPGPNQVQMFLAAEPKQAAAAEALERQGVHRDDIWRQTKAFRDTDGEWKREISDAPSRINPQAEEWMMKSGEGAQGLAPDVYEHPEAYEQLPGLRRHLVAMSPADQYGGGYTPAHTINPAYIEARGRTPEEIRWVMAHEMQHAADELAGLPAGSSPEMHYERLKGANPHSVAALSRDLANKGYENVPNFANYNDWDKYLRDLSKTLYRIDNSEVRARAAAERLNMTEEQRAATHPFESMDVPPEQQIIRKRQPRGMQQAASESTSASVPVTQPAPRSIDPLGYYSQALEAAKALPQAKGTPEQMLAQLKKAGVKDAEIQATNLPQFLEGKKSVTRDEIAQHLEDNRIGLNEVRRGGTDLAAQRNRLANEMFDRDYADLSSRERERVDVLGVANANLQPQWANYSLDPKNPTYRETVLHLPVPKESEARAQALADRERELFDQVNTLRRSRSHFSLIDDLSQPYGELERATEELYRVRDELGRLNNSLFRSGHFGEPNITGHLMTSMVKDKNGRNVFNIDQIQSDWGQKLRESGIRDEEKIADIQKQYDANDKKSQEAVRAAFSYVSAKTKGRNWTQTLREVADAGDKEAQRLLDDYLRTDREAKRLAAELSTAQHAASGHPLVNTTDQWVNTTLRTAIKQAAENGADAISIPSGDTVLSYNPGDRHGMNEFYGKIVPKNLKQLLKKLDPQSPPPEYHEKLVTPNNGAKGNGFTLFPITDTVRKAVRKGQPLFKSGGSVEKPSSASDCNGLHRSARQGQATQCKAPTSTNLKPSDSFSQDNKRSERQDGGPASHNNDFHESKLNELFETMMDEHPDMVPPSGSFVPKSGLQPDDPNFGNFRAIGSAFKYNAPPDARESTNIEDRRYTHPSLPTSDFGTYNGPMMGDPSPYRPAANSSAAGIQGMSGTQSGPSVTRAPWTAASISPFKTEVVSAQAHGGTVTMDNSMTKGPEKSHQASSVNPEHHTFNSEHLPPHERSFLHNPDEAYERSKHLIPYLRAGGEAHKRGEDFFGGTDQYERELAALKHFYLGTKQAPVAEEAPTAKEGFAKGGSVNKKVVHIHDMFKRRLEGQKRKLSSMEKAHARKTNPMLSRRIDFEKNEVERMRKHIDKIKSHIS